MFEDVSKLSLVVFEGDGGVLLLILSRKMKHESQTNQLNFIAIFVRYVKKRKVNYVDETEGGNVQIL